MTEREKSELKEKPADVSSSHARGPSDADLIDVDTSDDGFLGGKVQVLQLKSSYRAGSDAVMLAAAAPIVAGARARVLDAGAGVGVVGLCVLARCGETDITFVEREHDLCALAAGNARRNGAGGRAVVIEGDLTGPASDLAARGLELDSFDHVLANPPYFAQQRGTRARGPLRAGARAMEEGDLEHWARFLAACARPGGSMTMIHKADALSEVLAVVGHRFGALRVLPIHSRASEPAQRILVQGIKGSRAPLRILPGFIVHDCDNAFTRQAEAILRHGAALPLDY